MTPAPSTAITMTVASASAKAACAGLYRKRAQHRENSVVSKGRASAAKNAMLRFVARVLIARQVRATELSQPGVAGNQRGSTPPSEGCDCNACSLVAVRVPPWGRGLPNLDIWAGLRA